MYIVVQHTISDPAKFWEVAKQAQLPEEVKLHSTFPNTDGSKAVCLWEAKNLETVKNLLEEAVGQVSTNDYFEVETQNAIGLPNK